MTTRQRNIEYAAAPRRVVGRWRLGCCRCLGCRRCLTSRSIRGLHADQAIATKACTTAHSRRADAPESGRRTDKALQTISTNGRAAALRRRCRPRRLDAGTVHADETAPHTPVPQGCCASEPTQVRIEWDRDQSGQEGSDLEIFAVAKSEAARQLIGSRHLQCLNAILITDRLAADGQEGYSAAGILTIDPDQGRAAGLVPRFHHG